MSAQSVHDNERSYAIELISAINDHLHGKDMHIKRAGGESTINEHGRVKFRLFGGFCGRDSGIGPAQRAKTTIWN
ncbi:hypothetical protein [Gordonibacter urolithinfaciens]|uniref:hypothetical protein n=1 Tax=Gordonibacter urolithinfaciens TaxID=1335613 RepID=UPI003A8F8A20